jgi:hypothetical protein
MLARSSRDICTNLKVDGTPKFGGPSPTAQDDGEKQTTATAKTKATAKTTATATATAKTTADSLRE